MNCPPLISTAPPPTTTELLQIKLLTILALPEIRHYPAARVPGICRDQVASNDGIGLNAADPAAISGDTRRLRSAPHLPVMILPTIVGEER